MKQSKFEKYLMEQESFALGNLDNFDELKDEVGEYLGKGLSKLMPKALMISLINDCNNKGLKKLANSLSNAMEKSKAVETYKVPSLIKEK